MFEYIPDDFGRTWVASQDASRRGYYVPLAFIDILGGDRLAAEIFAQIMYWHQPDDQGKSRMSLVKDGFHWVAKNYRDWFSECRIVYATARKAIETLIEQQLIFKSTEGWAGEKTPWLRINWSEFRRRMTLWMKTSVDVLRQFEGKPAKDAEYRTAMKQYTEIPATPVTTEQGDVTPSHSPDMTGHSPLLPQDDPNTETVLELKRLKDSAATSAAFAVNLFLWMQNQVGHAIKQLEQTSSPASVPDAPQPPSPERWTRDRQNEIFDTVAKLSFGLSDPEAVRNSKKGVAGRIGKIVSLIQARAPKITVKELELFYSDYDEKYDSRIDAPQDDARFDSHFTPWFQQRNLRLLERRKPRATKPLGIGTTASMAQQEPEVSHG